MQSNPRTSVPRWLIGLIIILATGLPTRESIGAPLVCRGNDNPSGYAVKCGHGAVIAGDVLHGPQPVPGLKFWDVLVTAGHTDAINDPLPPNQDIVDFILTAEHLIEPHEDLLVKSAPGMYDITAEGPNQTVPGPLTPADHSALLPGHFDLHSGALATTGVGIFRREILSYRFLGTGVHCTMLSEQECPAPPEFPTLPVSEPTTIALIFLGLTGLGFIRVSRPL